MGQGLLLTVFAGMMLAPGMSAAAEWQAAHQPDLKEQLAKPAKIEPEALAAPARGVTSWTFQLVPNPDGKTYDALQWYFRAYSGPTWLYACDLATGEVRKQRFPDRRQIHMHGGMLASLTCGIVSAAMMVMGLLMGRERLEEGIDGIFPIVVPAQDLVARLEKRLGSTSCQDISGVDFTDLDRAVRFMSSGENAKCFDLVADGADEIARFLQELSEKGDLFRTGGA